jgi:hypothetical protein
MLMAPPGRALELMHAAGVQYILYCREFELGLIAEKAPSGVLATLLSDTSVVGIGELAKAADTNFAFYRVVPAEEAQAKAQ